MDDKLPTDLVALPTMPYEERPSELPLDREEVRTALWRCRGNVSDAAALLKTPPARLRQFVNNSSYLAREQAEAREQLADRAEDIVYEALHDAEDKGRRDGMAKFVLSNLAKQRGYSTGKTNINIDNKGGTIAVSWADGQSLEPPTIDAEPAE